MGDNGLEVVRPSALPQAAVPIILPVPPGAVKVLPRWADEDEVSKWRVKYRPHDEKANPDLVDDGLPWTELELRYFTRELPLSGLDYGLPHFFKVAIETPDGWSDWSNVVKCDVPSPTAPGKCAGVYAIVQDGSSVLLRWTKPLDFAVVTPALRITRYNILVSWVPRGDEEPEACCREIFVEEDTDSYVVTGLESLTEYHFQVAAENVAGWGDYSDPSPAVHVVPPVPITLNQPTLRRATHHSVVIQWQHPPVSKVPVDSFAFRHTSSRDWSSDVTEINDVAANLSQYVIDDLRPGQVYIFQVRALNRFGKAIWSESSIPIRTLDGDVPSRIEDLTAPEIYKSFIRLQWSPVCANGYPVTGHLVRFAHSPDMAGAVEMIPELFRKDAYDCCDIRHLRRRKYYFQMTAINFMAQAEWSNQVMIDNEASAPSLEDTKPPALSA